MAKHEPFFIPKVYTYHQWGTTGGSFGNYPLYDLSKANKSLCEFLDDNGRLVRFKDVCFGPYIDFHSLNGMVTRPVDDCLVACDSDDNVITIYDRNTIDNPLQRINWLDKSETQPIVFEPKLTLYATQKIVSDPRYPAKGQSFIETEVFKIIQNMGFDYFLSDTGKRFFKPLPQINGKTVKDSVAPDSAFLLKCGANFYAWYKIYSDKYRFVVSYFKDGKLSDTYSIPNIAQFIKNLQNDRINRDNYIKQQYNK